MYDKPRLLPAGDRGLVVEFSNNISPAINAKVRAFIRGLSVQSLPGMEEVVPTYRSVLVYFDPLVVDPSRVENHLLKVLANLATLKLPQPRLTRVPVCYGGDLGPDLVTVGRHTGLTVEEVIRRHSRVEYLIYMLGFTPGFPYLGGMDEAIATPRLATPRTLIPAGSVGIAGNQTGVYPIVSPGGWQLIGRTPLELYNPQADPPMLLAAGDYVRFVPIARQEYDELARQVSRGLYQIQTEVYKREGSANGYPV